MANLMIFKLQRQSKAKFPSKIGYYRSSKRSLHTCTVGLSPKNSALEVGMVKYVKFNDDLTHFLRVFEPNLTKCSANLERGLHDTMS